MSKKSHAKHEHKKAQAHEHQKEVAATDDYGPTFGEKHRKLIIVIAVAFLFLAPITFGVIMVLNALSR